MTSRAPVVSKKFHPTVSILSPETFRSGMPLTEDRSVDKEYAKPRIPKLRHRLEDAAEALDVSLSHLRNRIDEGSLPVVHDGSGVFVLDHVLRKYAGTNHPFSPAMRRKRRTPKSHRDTEIPPASNEPADGCSAMTKPAA
jgi:hypothetical protein